MGRIAVLVVSALALTSTALSHITDDPDSIIPYSGYDCSAMAGMYSTSAGKAVRIDVADAAVVFTLVGESAVIGECIAPVIENGSIYPSARVALDKTFDGSLPDTGCCVATLKVNTLTLDSAGLTWTKN